MANFVSQKSQRRTSILRRTSSTSIESNDLPSMHNSNASSPSKFLFVHGKCSEDFRLAMKDSVEDCILQFNDEKPIYVPPTSTFNGENRINSNVRFERRRSSAKSNNSLSFPAIAMATTRIRHSIVLQRLSINQNISEEVTTVSADSNNLTNEIRSNANQNPKFDKNYLYSSRKKQKDFRISDLVMLGPEPFADVFQLPRSSRSIVSSRMTTRSQAQTETTHHRSVEEKYIELEHVKQDLFHRYLWTKKPQVSCRIRPLPSYTRSHSTFIK